MTPFLFPLVVSREICVTTLKKKSKFEVQSLLEILAIDLHGTARAPRPAVPLLYTAGREVARQELSRKGGSNFKVLSTSCGIATEIIMVTRYRRVAQAESPGEQDVKKKRADRIERITAKLHALIWIATSAALILYTNIFKLALSDDRVNRYESIVSLSRYDSKRHKLKAFVDTSDMRCLT